jgi:methyltransferase (TIGR00027 family)
MTMKPVSKTAFYCAGVRARDARRPRPVCGDHLAERLMDEEAWRLFEPFADSASTNVINATRHRILDDHLRQRLAEDPRRRVVIVGAGLDTRAFRLPGGRFVEIDEPAVFEWKEPRLPAAECPNQLVRLAIDFETESLAERLARFATPEPVFVVVEGVLLYLGEERMRALLRTIRSLFPRAEVGCEIITAEFLGRFGRAIHDRIRWLGASFHFPALHPAEIFRQEGFDALSHESVAGRAVAAGAMPWWGPFALALSRTFREGYEVWVFSAAGANATAPTGRSGRKERDA